MMLHSLVLCTKIVFQRLGECIYSIFYFLGWLLFLLQMEIAVASKLYLGEGIDQSINQSTNQLTTVSENKNETKNTQKITKLK